LNEKTLRALNDIENNNVGCADSFEEILESIGISLTPVKKLFDKNEHEKIKF
jgi:DNA-binding Lrp family transcriptional regulator